VSPYEQTQFAVADLPGVTVRLPQFACGPLFLGFWRSLQFNGLAAAVLGEE
jgi:hypothetical protein